MVIEIRVRCFTRFGLRDLIMARAIYCKVPLGTTNDPSIACFPLSLSATYPIFAMIFYYIGGVEKVLQISFYYPKYKLC